MRRLLLLALLALTGALAANVPPGIQPISAETPANPTFNKDILPILQRNCQECHRPGAIAPMSFTSSRKRVTASLGESGTRREPAAVSRYLSTELRRCSVISM